MNPEATGVSSRSVTAPGQYLGYSLQVSRLLDHLISAGPGETVSLEILGDTAVEDAGGNTLVEESKSRVSAANPISDRSEEFWKTIRNWVDAVSQGRLDAESTRFQLYVSRPFSGSIAESFHNARDKEQAKAALAAVVEQLSPQSRGGTKETPSLGKHLAAVLDADPSIVVSIIERFELAFGSGNSLNALQVALESTYVPPELADDVLNQAMGWLKLYTDGQIERGEPAAVAWNLFRDVVTGIVRKLDRRDMLASVAKDPEAADVAAHLRLKTYVRQLALIDLDDDDKIRAVTDFIKAEADRVHWALKGRVIENSFDEFEEELTLAWRNYQRKTEISQKSLPATERGQLLYVDCCGHSLKLAGSEVPAHFCRGSYHRLSDTRLLGWHPDYATLLGKRQSLPAMDPTTTSPISVGSDQRAVATRGLATRRSRSRPSIPKRGGDPGGDAQ
jgi:hypothetical protein